MHAGGGGGNPSHRRLSPCPPRSGVYRWNAPRAVPRDTTCTMGRGTMTDEFFQDAPRLGDQYEDDALLRSFLRWRLPADVHAAVEPGLRRLGARAATDILAMG